jgi:hypothetical protein
MRWWQDLASSVAGGSSWILQGSRSWCTVQPPKCQAAGRPRTGIRCTGRAIRRSAQAAIEGVEAAQEGQRRTHELTEQGQRTDRFTAAVAQLGAPSPAIQLGGVHALAGLADDARTRDFRQTCIDVLCAFLRLPDDSDPGDGPAEGKDLGEHARASSRSLREVRHTVIRVVGNHLRAGAPVSWQGHDFDFPGAAWAGGTVDFTHRRLTRPSLTFGEPRRPAPLQISPGMRTAPSR